MDHIGSGAVFFEPHVIEQHRRMFGSDPKTYREFDFRKNIATDAMPSLIAKREVRAVQKSAAKKGWAIWCDLPHDGRPNQTKHYVFGIDISKGQGASNSIVSVYCAETREKVGEYANANVPPYDLARIVCAAAIWWGGAKLPYLCWEANGPGWDFGRQVVKIYNYPRYYVDRSSGTVSEKRQKRYGWHSSREKKEVMLGNYRRALAGGEYINHSIPALNETLTYIYYDNGGLGPAELMKESNEARKVHGDRVIADALCLVGAKELGKGARPAVIIPPRSMAWRKKQLERERKARRSADTFDFTMRS
jgi:hypothetical protein